MPALSGYKEKRMAHAGQKWSPRQRRRFNRTQRLKAQAKLQASDPVAPPGGLLSIAHLPRPKVQSQGRTVPKDEVAEEQFLEAIERVQFDTLSRLYASEGNRARVLRVAEALVHMFSA
jgi:hypothetical protein